METTEPTKATYKDVGLIAIPLDNSYSMNLATFQNDFLAGKEVKIVSRPFKIPILTYTWKAAVKEFVLVKHGEEIIRILNTFKIITNRK